MKMTRRRFLETAGGAVAAGAAGFRPAAAQGLTPIKVGCVVLGDFGINAPTMVGIEKGFFKQNGLEAEMIPFKGGPDLLKGVLAGSAPTSASRAPPIRSCSASVAPPSARWPPSSTRTTSRSR